MRGVRISVLVKLAVFGAVAILCAVLVTNTFVKPLSGATHSYRAVFTDATGLGAGDDVLIGGVRVGRVSDVALQNGKAVVGFEVDAGQHVPADVRIAIRYADLLGARTLTILPGPSGPRGEPELTPGAVVANTQPALDLTVLLNGFKPLFDAIDPGAVNQLAGEMVAVFQGEGGTIGDLLTHLISVTQNVASRANVIDAVLRNLTSLVDFTVAHRPDLDQLVDSLSTLVGGLAQDRAQLGDTIDAGSQLAKALSGTLDRLDPQIAPLLNSLRGTTTTFEHNTPAFTEAMQSAPGLLDTLGRTLDYGSWVNVYVCNLNLDLGPLGTARLQGGPHSEVCR